MDRAFFSKKVNLLLVFALSGLLLSACSSVNEKDEGEGNCCEIGDTSVPGVTLERICRKRSATVFHFQLTVGLEACVDLQRTALEDNSGKSYRGLSHAGLADCAEPLSPQPAGPFQWTYEPISRDAQSLSLAENYKLDVQPWMSWKWEDLDVAHCTF